MSDNHVCSTECNVPSGEDDLAISGGGDGVLLTVVEEFDTTSNESAARGRKDACNRRVHEDLQVRSGTSLLKVRLRRKPSVLLQQLNAVHAVVYLPPTLCACSCAGRPKPDPFLCRHDRRLAVAPQNSHVSYDDVDVDRWNGMFHPSYDGIYVGKTENTITHRLNKARQPESLKRILERDIPSWTQVRKSEGNRTCRRL